MKVNIWEQGLGFSAPNPLWHKVQCVWTTCSRPGRLLFILYWCLFVAARCEYRFSTGNLNAVLAKIISCLIYLSPGSLWVVLEAKWFESDQRWFNIAGLKFCLVWHKLLWNRHWRKTIKVTKQSASVPVYYLWWSLNSGDVYKQSTIYL